MSYAVRPEREPSAPHMKTRLADFVLEPPLASLVLVVIGTAVFGSFAAGLRFDHSSVSHCLAEDSRTYAAARVHVRPA